MNGMRSNTTFKYDRWLALNVFSNYQRNIENTTRATSHVRRIFWDIPTSRKVFELHY